MNVFQRLIVKITGDNKDLKSSLTDSEKSVNKFSGAVKAAGAAIVAVFALDKIISFTKEIITLAAKAEGVRQGFNSLNDPTLLNELRKATRGTVTDLELMQRAVMANNFKIPLSQLATYFEFATKRATLTGQSVDYLVDSIVTGIGRKSVLVMDNLGISAVELQNEVQKVGDFGIAAGNIIRRELESMGDVAETTATRISTISTSWTNIKTSMGTLFTESEMVRKSLEGVASALKNISERGLLGSIFEKRSTWEKRQAEKALWDIPAEAVPYMDKGTMLPQVNIQGQKASPKGPKVVRPVNPGLNIERPGSISPSGISGIPELAGLQEVNIALYREITKMEEILTVGRDMAVDLGAQVIEGLGEALAGGNLQDIGKGLLLSLANFLSQFGKLLITMGLGMEAFAKSLATMNPLAAIAGGAAMLLAAGAIRGLVSGGARQVSGGGGGYGGGNLQTQNMKVQVVGKISGKDIVIASQRYINDN